MSTSLWLAAHIALAANSHVPKYSKDWVKATVKTCIDDQMELYGDLIGEGDQDGKTLVGAMGDAMLHCIDEMITPAEAAKHPELGDRKIARDRAAIQLAIERDVAREKVELDQFRREYRESLRKKNGL